MTSTAGGSPYALECCLERDGIKTLKSMLVCLDRFGKELFLEANGAEVTLRTLNAAQSAFIIFTLQSDFFSKYRVRAARAAAPTPRPRPLALSLCSLASLRRRSLGRWRRRRTTARRRCT